MGNWDPTSWALGDGERGFTNETGMSFVFYEIWPAGPLPSPDLYLQFETY
jgi:hypothetical protein